MPVTCYAESQDGIHWDKPELGLCEWCGSTANNINLTGPREVTQRFFTDARRPTRCPRRWCVRVAKSMRPTPASIS